MSSKSPNNTDPIRLQGNRFVRLFDSFFVLRPTLIFPLWTMTLAGSGLAKNDVTLEPWSWFLFSLALTSMFGLVYFLNQLKDQETDKVNNKLFLITGEVFSKRHLVLETAILIVIAVAGLIWAGLASLGLWILGLFALIGILYNFTPLALKQRPWGGLIAYALSGWMFVRLGEMIYGNTISVVMEAPYVISFIAGCVITNLPDLEGDLAENKRTFVVAYGARTTVLVSVICYLLALGWGLINFDWVVYIPPLLTLPWMIKALIRRDSEAAVRANKWAIFLLSVTVGMAYPVYLVVIALYLPFARWYHRRRFGMSYPSFH